MSKTLWTTLVAGGVFWATILATPAPAAGAAPVSPEGRIHSTCPTFSWSAAGAAGGFELVVFAVDENGEVGSTALLSKRLPAGTGAWTPSTEDCLRAGGTYAWTLREVGPEDGSAWPEAAVFEVTAGPSIEEVEQAIATLRRYVRQRRETADSPPDEEPAPPAAGSSDLDREVASALARGTVLPTAAPKHESRPLGSEPSEPTLVSKAAPTLGTASLTVSDQLHLDADSHVFKDGAVFLWDDSSSNLALGEGSLASASGDAANNTAVGPSALQDTTGGTSPSEGSHNTALGSTALRDNTIGFRNTALGSTTLIRNTTGSRNTAVGFLAHRDNTTGFRNTAVGGSALLRNTTGARNTAIGERALLNSPTGDDNIAIGHLAGTDLGKESSPSTNLSDNIFIGNEGGTDEQGTIRLGASADHDRTFIAGITGVQTGSTGEAVFVDAAGQLGTTTCGTYEVAQIFPVGCVQGPNCDEVPPGAFCEGDGECGTDDSLDNCNGTDWYFRTD